MRERGFYQLVSTPHQAPAAPPSWCDGVTVQRSDALEPIGAPPILQSRVRQGTDHLPRSLKRAKTLSKSQVNRRAPGHKSKTRPEQDKNQDWNQDQATRTLNTLGLAVAPRTISPESLDQGGRGSI